MKKLNNNLNEEITKMIKSDFSAIKTKMKKNEGVILEMEERKEKKFNFNYAWLSVPTLALGAFMLFMIVGANKTTVVTLDVNPSLQFKVNKDSEIKEIISLNEDGTEIVEVVNKNEDLDDALEKLISKLVEEGYITNEKNSVLVSVEGENAEKLKKEITEEIEETLNDKNIVPSVITQTVEESKENNELAEKHNISVGKVVLINKILKVNSLYSFEKLANLTMDQLNLLLSNDDNDLYDIEINGEVNTEKYITEDEALAIALNKVNLTESQIKNLDIDFDVEDGVVVYEIEFDSITNNAEYEFDINAETGEIIDSEIDINEDDNNDDNDDDNNDDNDDDDNDDDNDDDDNDDNDDNDDDDNDDDDDNNADDDDDDNDND